MPSRLARSHDRKKPLRIRIRKNDMVKVIAGRDKGKVGRVLEVNRETGRILVEGVMMVKKHVRRESGARHQGRHRRAREPHPRLQRDDPDKRRQDVAHRQRTEMVGGKLRRVRVAVKTGEVLDKK